MYTSTLYSRTLKFVIISYEYEVNDIEFYHIIIRVILPLQIFLQYFYKRLMWNFQIIIDKYKCDISGRPILELIRIYHINNL